MKSQPAGGFSSRPIASRLVAVIAAGLIAIALTPAAAGISLLADASEGALEDAKTDSPPSSLSSSARSMEQIQFHEQNWDFRVGEVLGVPSASGLAGDEFSIVEQYPLAYAKSGKLNSGLGEGLNDFRFIEGNQLILSRNEIEYMTHNWDFTGGTPLIEAPVSGRVTVGSPEMGLSSGMINQFGPQTPGPGDGLNDFRFVEENVQLPNAQTRRDGPGEGLNDYRFIEENTFDYAGAVERSKPTSPRDIQFREDNEFGARSGTSAFPWNGDAFSPDY